MPPGLLGVFTSRARWDGTQDLLEEEVAGSQGDRDLLGGGIRRSDVVGARSSLTPILAVTVPPPWWVNGRTIERRTLGSR